MQTLASGLAAEHPDTNTGWSVRLAPLADEVARTSRLELLLVFAAMFCLLLLVCANVASLAIARGVARAREMAIRLALGAGGRRLTRQLIAESALSAVVTVVIAIVLTAWWVDAALSIAPAGIPRLHEVAVNARVASFAAVLALLVTAVGNAVPTVPRQPHTNCRRAQGRGGRVGERVWPAARGAGGGRDCRRGDAARRRRAAGPDLCRVPTGRHRLRHRQPPGLAHHARCRAISHVRADDRLLPPGARVTSRGAGDRVGGRGHGPADEHDRVRLHPAVLARACPP